MNILGNSKISLLLAALLGAGISYGLFGVMVGDSAHQQKILSLEHKVAELEALLAQQAPTLHSKRLLTGNLAGPSLATTTNPADTAGKNDQSPTESVKGEADSAAATNHEQVLKDLLTLAYGDPRSFVEKVQEFLAQNPGRENIAIASKGVYDLAENRDNLPDYALDTLYHQQTNTDLKRVTAQVLSMRGDNRLLEKQITDMQAGLRSENPADRQKVLVELAKTRYVSAANAVVPLLQDEDIGVKLDALLALRSTGNQTHIGFVESLVNHPDASVSWLANDVINTLQNLSDRARTRITQADIAAELPPIM